MKKSFFLTMLAVVLSLGTTFACTNFIVTKGASKDGSCFLTYAADSHSLYGELYYRPAADYPAGTMMDIVEWDTGKLLGQIPQVAHTYSVVGNMNEWQLAIGETTYGGIEELEQGQGMIDYGSLIYIALQRAKNAREAIKVIAELMDTYGYASEGESFSIVDPDEAWIMEIIGKGEKMLDAKGKIVKGWSNGAVWVARRIPDGYISGHANQSRITTFRCATARLPSPARNSTRYSCLPWRPFILTMLSPSPVSKASIRKTPNRLPTQNSASVTPTIPSPSATLAAAKLASGLSSITATPQKWLNTKTTLAATTCHTASRCGSNPLTRIKSTPNI